MSFGSFLSNAWHAAWDPTKEAATKVVGEAKDKIDKIVTSTPMQKDIGEFKNAGNKIQSLFQSTKANYSTNKSSINIPCPITNECTLSLTYKTEKLTEEDNQIRTKIAVTEVVTITANNPKGQVTWKLINSNTDTNTNSCIDIHSGYEVKVTAGKIAEIIVVEALDSGGGANCNKTLRFEVSCCYYITPKILESIFPLERPKAEKFIRTFNKMYEQFSFKECYHKALFFAECMKEATSGLPKAENLSYSANQLVVTWPNRFTHDASLVGLEAENNKYPDIYVLASDYAYQSDKIGNQAYAYRNGNGAPVTGDGYKYRGRGYIQITGKSTYASTKDEVSSICGEEIDIVSHPELVSDNIKEGLLTAMAYFTKNEFESLIANNIYNDECSDESITCPIDIMTKMINGGLFSRLPTNPSNKQLNTYNSHRIDINARRANYLIMSELFNLEKCPSRKERQFA